MARQTNGINGGYLGKVGGVVGYMWRGQYCVRSMPRFYHDAKTEKQMDQRSLFKASVAFAGRLKDILRLGFQKQALALHKTECNYFLMVNKRCLAWDGECMAVDYGNLRVSEGPVAPVAFTGVERGVMSDELIVIFEKNPEHRNCNGNDKVYVAALCAGRGEAVLSLPVYRRMKSVTVVLPEVWEGEEVHLYGFVQDSAGRCSESCYIPAECREEEPEGLSDQECAGGDARGGGDAEEVGACGPGRDIKGGGEARGGPVIASVPQDVGDLDMRHG